MTEARVAEDLLTVFERCGPQLHGLLLRLTLRADVAEELMQELFLKLRRSPAFGRAANPRGYAFRAAIHLALDSRRRTRKFAELPPELTGAGISPAESAVRAEQAEQVLRAIAGLSALAREAAVLHFIEQHSYEEAATMMGKTPQQVRGLCQDALRQLRVRFQVSPAKEAARE